MKAKNKINKENEYLSDEQLDMLLNYNAIRTIEGNIAEYYGTTDKPLDEPFHITLEQKMTSLLYRNNACQFAWSKAVAFIGPRPGQGLYINEKNMRILLEKAINQAINDGYGMFLTGMNLGMELFAAEIILKYRQKNPDIHLVCVIPHRGYEKDWKKKGTKII